MSDTNKMINEKSWSEFRDCGILWYVNSFLHMFGWAICLEFEDGVVTRAYPARVKFRGFDENTVTDGYKKVSKYLKENINELEKEANE